MLISRSGSSSSSSSTFRVSTQFVRGLILSSAIISLAAFSAGAKARERQSAEEAEPSSYSDYSFFSGVNWQIEPYVGADAAIRNMRYKDEPTHPFQEHLNTFQPFVGLRLHQYFGIEAGYQQSQKGTKERFFNKNEMPMFFGGQALLLSDGGVTDFNLDLLTSNTTKGWNVGVVGFYPIVRDKTDLFVKLAYTNLSNDITFRFILRDPTDTSFPEYHVLHDKTGMTSLTLGVKQQFTHHLGGRFFVNMDRTSRLHYENSGLKLGELVKGQIVESNRESGIFIRPHNSWTMGVGMFYSWK